MIEFQKNEMEAAAVAIKKAHVQQIMDLVQGSLLWKIHGSEIIFEEFDSSKEF